jgi:hypothetical protein
VHVATIEKDAYDRLRMLLAERPRMRLRLTSFLLFGSLATVAACSSSSNGGGGGTCGAYFDALASLSQKCGEPIGSPNHIGELRTKFVTLCQNELNAPGATNAASAIQQCADQLNAAQSCNAPDCKTPAGDLAVGAPCGEGFQCQSGHCQIAKSSTGGPSSQCGTCTASAAIGEACGTNDVQCAPNATCTSSGSTGKLTCVERKTVKEGEVCFDPKAPSSGVKCDVGLHCPISDVTSSSSPPATCKRPSASGEACSGRSDCVIGLTCIANKCADPLAEGATCKGGDCAAGLGCDVSTKKCTTITFVADGQPCDDAIHFCDTGRCIGLSVTGGSDGVTKVTPGTCKPSLPDGSACDPQSSEGGHCDEFSECIAGTCQQKNASQCK